MKEILYAPSDGGVYTIRVVETITDLEEVRDWTYQTTVVGFDTETTGLDTYAPGNRLRLVQFGDKTQSYVVPYEGHEEEFGPYLRYLIDLAQVLVIQNAEFDTKVVSRHLGVPIHRLWSKVVDTKILAHLVDSRQRKDGGTGHSLEELTAAHISAVIAEEVKASVRLACKRLKITKAQYFKTVPIDDEEYLLYAGMDPILNVLAYEALKPLVPLESHNLIQTEHELAELTATVSDRGWLLDEPATQLLGMELDQQGEDADDTAWDWYLDNVNSPKQVLQALDYAGIQLDGRTTPAGQPSVDGKFLDRVSHPLTKAIVVSKRATKWKSAYVENFLGNMDHEGRVHPVINTLAARTARFSVQFPALQTCPPGVKQCLLAEEGHVTCAIDYVNQEMRVGAALSGDRVMIRAFMEGKDLHQITADAAGVSRDIGKMANFLTVYGGGVNALMLQGDIDEETARRVIYTLKVTYPDLTEFGRETAAEVRSRGYVMTRSGRRLYVDRDRAYSGVNYKIQSESRDVTARAMLRLKDRQKHWLRMAVHDELVFSIPEEQTFEAYGIAKVMEDNINGVELPVEVKIGARSWGSLYVAKEPVPVVG